MIIKSLVQVVLVCVLAVFVLTNAQSSPYVLKTYDLTQLDARPGDVVISPDVLTLLEFDDQILDVSTARPDAMTIEVNGSVIRLRSNWRAGRTDLVVTVANQTAMFTITIEPEGQHTRRYVIKKPEPPRPTASSTSNPISKAADGLKLDSDIPTWLSVSFNVLAVSGKETVIQYGVRNAGKNDIVSDAYRLKILQEAYQTPFELERFSTGGTSNRIKPGFAEYGIILVPEPLPGKLSLVWELVEVGPGYTHILREDFHEGLLEQTR